MEFSNNAAIATLKVINQRMDYLSNEVLDRSYDELMELNQLGEMRQQLEREAFIDYDLNGLTLSDDPVVTVAKIRKVGDRPTQRFFDEIHWADRDAARAIYDSVLANIMAIGVNHAYDAKKYATLIAECNAVQYAKGEAA
jgi:curved DNA-binding protein CbpA